MDSRIRKFLKDFHSHLRKFIPWGLKSGENSENEQATPLLGNIERTSFGESWVRRQT